MNFKRIGGFKQITNECQNCKTNFSYHNLNNPKCYNYELFYYLIFPLEEIKNKKYNYSMNENFQEEFIVNNIVTLNECFEYNNKTEKLSGYCPQCKVFFDSIYSTKIYYGPNVLILILKREKNNILDVKLDYQESIDISNYILEKDMNNMIYNLYGVISKVGQNGPSGHFIANCKSSIDNNWYRFDDDIIRQVFDIQKDVIDYGIPYILFYKKEIYNKNIFGKYNIK